MRLAFSGKLHKDILILHFWSLSDKQGVCCGGEGGGGYRNEIASFCDKREVQKETKLQSPIYIVGAILILTTSLDKKDP